MSYITCFLLAPFNTTFTFHQPALTTRPASKAHSTPCEHHFDPERQVVSLHTLSTHLSQAWKGPRIFNPNLRCQMLR